MRIDVSNRDARGHAPRPAGRLAGLPAAWICAGALACVASACGARAGDSPAGPDDPEPEASEAASTALTAAPTPSSLPAARACSAIARLERCTLSCPAGMYPAKYTQVADLRCPPSDGTPNAVVCQPVCATFTACGGDGSCPPQSVQLGTTHTAFCATHPASTSEIQPNAVICRAT